MNTDQAKAWAGEFGNAYTNRNRVDWRRRMPFWRDIMDRTGARSVLEVGCNAGWNLSAIRAEAPWARVVGIDINQQAVKQACRAGLEAWYSPHGIMGLPNSAEESYELVFTAGVLIHIPQPELEQAMQAIIEASCRWVLAIEYHAEHATEIPYRDGRRDMLWKRPFGRLYEDRGLKLAGPTHVLGPDQGFDNCTVYLLEKP